MTMTCNPITIRPDVLAAEALHVLEQRKITSIVVDLVGIDACVCQPIVLFLRHGKHKPMSNNGTFRGRRDAAKIQPSSATTKAS
jgi:hypothetical protein